MNESMCQSNPWRGFGKEASSFFVVRWPPNLDLRHLPCKQMQFLSENRQGLLAKVRSFWIKGMLENSLHGAALMVLGLQEPPDAVAHPWQLVMQETDQSTRPLPLGTRVTQVYDEAVGELLILGKPGSGKTTLLLELARDLLDRTEKESSLPMPMVFNPSSWAARQPPFAEWLVDEMNTKYQGPRSLGQAWIAADFDLTTRILLLSAVVVQPLSEQQIDSYLSNAGQHLETVRAALREDQTHQELVTTPLMLSVLILAYTGKPVEKLGMAGTAEMRRRHPSEIAPRPSKEREGCGIIDMRQRAGYDLDVGGRARTAFQGGLFPYF